MISPQECLNTADFAIKSLIEELKRTNKPVDAYVTGRMWFRLFTYFNKCMPELVSPRKL